MRNKTLFTCLLFLAPIAVAADATSGRFFMGGGVGAVECPKFVASIDRAKKHGSGTIGYANETQGYVMFMFGFQTAYNLQTADTCDIFGDFSPDQLLAWTENYCRNKPLEKFGSAVVALAEEVHPVRLRSCK